MASESAPQGGAATSEEPLAPKAPAPASGPAEYKARLGPERRDVSEAGQLALAKFHEDGRYYSVPWAREA